jgi:hypothetical protein
VDSKKFREEDHWNFFCLFFPFSFGNEEQMFFSLPFTANLPLGIREINNNKKGSKPY